MNYKIPVLFLVNLFFVFQIAAQPADSIASHEAPVKKTDSVKQDANKKQNSINKVSKEPHLNKTDIVEPDDKSGTEISTKAIKVRFDILEFRITGNTLLAKTVLESSVYSFLGRNKSFDDIEKARSMLERVYKNAGYPAVAVSIPEQNVKNGVIKLQVVEGKISRIKVTGSKYHSLKEIKQKIPALSRGNVLYLPNIQKQLNRLNQESPDRSITPVLKPGRYPGTVEVELRVKDKLPVHGGIDIDNRNTSNTTPLRVSTSLRYDNLFQKQHSFGMQYQTSPKKTEEVKVLALTYMEPIGDENDRLVMYAIDSNSDVSTLGDVTILGKGKIFGTRWVKPLTGTQSYFHSLSFGMDYKNFRDTQQIAGVDTVFPISYWSATVRYDSSLVRESELYQYNASIVIGLPFDSKQDEFTAKRIGSKTNFLYFTGGFSYKYSFVNDIKIITRADAQLATSPLISNEQFIVGGANSVRGYYQSQVVNDSGLTASIELVSPRIYESIKSIKDFRAHIFYDGSKTWRKDPLPGEEDTAEIAGTGLGFRFLAFDELIAEMDVAWALKDEGDVKKNDVRWHFKLAYEF